MLEEANIRRLSILIVEDDALTRCMLRKRLAGYSVESFDGAEPARRRLGEARFDLCVLDLDLGGGGRLAGLRLIPPAVQSGAYTVVHSGNESEDVIRRCYDAGCHEYLHKYDGGWSFAEVLLRAGAFTARRDPPGP